MAFITDDGIDLQNMTGFFYVCLWKIEMENPAKPNLYYTDHDQEIYYGADVYTPIYSVTPSAVESQTSMREDTRTFSGLIDVDEITDEDLEAGVFRNAKITETVLDWRSPESGALWNPRIFYVGEVTRSKFGWVADTHDLAGLLKLPIGGRCDRDCGWRFGQVLPGGAHGYGCANLNDGVILANWQVSASVSQVLVDRRKINTTIPTASGYPDNWWKYGTLEWTSGDNEGLSYDIRKSEEPFGTLWLDIATAYPIGVGNSFIVTAGCNRTVDHCVTKFDNIKNYKGGKWIPGPDVVYQTP